MLSLQSQLNRCSINLTKSTPCMLFFNTFCKKCSQSIKVADKGDVSEEEVSNKIGRERLRDREISLLEPIDTRFPLPGNIGYSPLFFRSTEVKQIDKSVNSISQLELIFELNPEIQARVIDVVLSQLVNYDLANADSFQFIVKECPQLLYKDLQLLVPSIVSKSVTLVTLYRKKNDERDKEEVIRHFVSVSQEICRRLENLGYWAYFVNPFDVKIKSNANGFEAGQRFRCCSFSVKSSKKCTLITYRNWGKDLFVGSLFTNASCHSELRDILDEMSYLLVKQF